MWDLEQEKLIWQGVDVWNAWREENPDIVPNLSGIDLRKTKLSGINLRNADLTFARLRNAELKNADLSDADLSDADFRDANLSGALLKKSKVIRGLFNSTNLSKANLSSAYFYKSQLTEANFQRAILIYTTLSSDLAHADFSNADLTNAMLHDASCRHIIFKDATLCDAKLRDADLFQADLRGANLSGADLLGANLWQSQCTPINLSKADLSYQNLNEFDLRDSDLSEANLTMANLVDTDLSNSNLTNAILNGANFVRTNLNNTLMSGCSIYGINVWDIQGEVSDQNDLVITPKDQPIITVDNIKVAQFIYLILDNAEIRQVINALTSKSVLILGRFSLSHRKKILDSLREKLREYDLLPIVFDFDRPNDQDFTETIKTLAGICFFVIADITNPKSAPLELQATIPDYQVPFVPIIQEGESPFSMMANLQSKYDWVLDTLEYDSVDTLLNVLKPAIIDPAMEIHNKLRVIKDQGVRVRTAKDYLK